MQEWLRRVRWRLCGAVGGATHSCVVCSYPADEHDKHYATECTHRAVKCPNHCQASKDGKVKAKDLEQHLKSTCDGRFVPCRLGCAMKVRPRFRERHETEVCNKRRMRCRLGCRETLLGADVYKHEHELCPERLVECGLVRHADNAGGTPCVRRNLLGARRRAATHALWQKMRTATVRARAHSGLSRARMRTAGRRLWRQIASSTKRLSADTRRCGVLPAAGSSSCGLSVTATCATAARSVMRSVGTWVGCRRVRAMFTQFAPAQTLP